MFCNIVIQITSVINSAVKFLKVKINPTKTVKYESLFKYESRFNGMELPVIRDKSENKTKCIYINCNT